MAKTYYKATRPDGRDFRTGKVDYAAALTTGEPVDVGGRGRKLVAECCGPSVLHASVVPTETLIGGSWPCRLFKVEGRAVATEGHKRGFRSLRVVAEIDPTHALGPQGAQLVDLIGQAGRLTLDDARSLDAAWHAAWDAAWDAARNDKPERTASEVIEVLRACALIESAKEAAEDQEAAYASYRWNIAVSSC